MAVEADVRNALQAVNSSRARLDAAGLARQSAEEQYASEQRQFQAGTSIVFLVLQRQTDLIAARNRELRAHADFAEALANLDRATARTIEARGIKLQTAARREPAIRTDRRRPAVASRRGQLGGPPTAACTPRVPIQMDIYATVAVDPPLHRHARWGDPRGLLLRLRRAGAHRPPARGRAARR
jgi:hypothetical protein